MANGTRQHWIQRITFAAEKNAASRGNLRRAVSAERTDRQTHPHTQTPTNTIIPSPLAKRRS